MLCVYIHVNYTILDLVGRFHETADKMLVNAVVLPVTKYKAALTLSRSGQFWHFFYKLAPLGDCEVYKRTTWSGQCTLILLLQLIVTTSSLHVAHVIHM